MVIILPCVYVETNRLKGILGKLLELPPHNWLISDLECYDYCGWDGCEKWGEQTLFLSDEELRHDVEERDMQIIWGVFSAIPKAYSREEVFKYSLPKSENPYYMSNQIAPQHPLAFLELYVDDGDFTFVSSSDSALLKPLYRLHYNVHDEEAENRIMNAQLRHIQDILRKEVPELSPEAANEVQWNVWHSVFKGKTVDICDHELRSYIMEAYCREMHNSHSNAYHRTLWDPYLQE